VKRALLALALIAAPFAVILVALGHGPLAVPAGDLLRALAGGGTAEAELALSLRLPRIVTALLVGGGVAGAGAAFQIIFRNPLVAPDLLGVSAGAGFGAAAAIVAGLGMLVVQGAAFAGGLAAAGLALLCARLARGGDPRLSLVLCGIVTGALASALLALMLFIAEPYAQLPALTYWLLGSFSRATAGELWIAAAPIASGLALLLALGFRLDLLALGDEQARSLGLNAPAFRRAAIAGATLSTSAAVAISGVIGWIGLLAPHGARLIVGSRANLLLPASIWLGALFALIVDRLSLAFGPAEVPAGLLAAGVGAPLFLVLFVSTSRSGR